jgi:hypothetical protein
MTRLLPVVTLILATLAAAPACAYEQPYQPGGWRPAPTQAWYQPRPAPPPRWGWRAPPARWAAPPPRGWRGPPRAHWGGPPARHDRGWRDGPRPTRPDRGHRDGRRDDRRW